VLRLAWTLGGAGGHRGGVARSGRAGAGTPLLGQDSVDRGPALVQETPKLYDDAGRRVVVVVALERLGRSLSEINRTVEALTAAGCCCGRPHEAQPLPQETDGVALRLLWAMGGRGAG